MLSDFKEAIGWLYNVPLYLGLLEWQIIQKDAATQPCFVHVDTCRYWYKYQNPSYSPFLTNPISPAPKNAFCEVLILKDTIKS